MVSAAALVFLFTIEHFKVWEQRPADPDAEPLKLPEFDRVGTTWLGTPAIAARTTYSLGFILAAAAGFAFLSPSRGQPRDGTEAGSPGQGRRTLWIDGNLDGYGVAFKHEEHEKREGGKESCVKCHHMNLPRDKNTACSLPQRHVSSVRRLPARLAWVACRARVACYQCHPGARCGAPPPPRTATAATKTWFRPARRFP